MMAGNLNMLYTVYLLLAHLVYIYIYIHIHTDVSGGFYATICNVEYMEEADALIVQGVSSENLASASLHRRQKAVTWQ